MRLEDYFDILTPNDIRLKGHRIGIEDILYEYIHNAMSPETMTARFPTLTLEQIYATILYYLRHKETLDSYLADWLERTEQRRREQAANPTPTILHLRRLRAEREAQQATQKETA